MDVITSDGLTGEGSASKLTQHGCWQASVLTTRACLKTWQLVSPRMSNEREREGWGRKRERERESTRFFFLTYYQKWDFSPILFLKGGSRSSTHTQGREFCKGVHTRRQRSLQVILQVGYPVTHSFSTTAVLKLVSSTSTDPQPHLSLSHSQNFELLISTTGLIPVTTI